MNKVMLTMAASVAAAAAPACAQNAAPSSGGFPTNKVPVALPAAPLAGQAADVQDIVVTAQKRSESLQQVPISITALSAEKLQQANVNTVADLVRVTPGFTGGGRDRQIANARLYVRGIGGGGNTAVEPSVATFLDDVYIARPGAIIGSFYDVSAIEVLRGPQGTLFGRNASAGAISVHTNQPTDRLEGLVAAQGGNLGGYKFEGTLNVPVSDTFAVRVAGLASGHGDWAHTSYGDHGYENQFTRGARVSTKFKPTPDITWVVRADYLKVGGDGANESELLPETLTPAGIAALSRILGARGLPDVTDPYDRKSRNNIVGRLNDRQWGLNSDLSWNIGGGGYTLRLIDSYRRWKDNQLDGDLLLLPIDALYRDVSLESKAQSHELQFISPKGALLGGKFDFVSGLYYFREKYNIGETDSFGPDWCGTIIPLVRPALVPACSAGSQTDPVDFTFRQTSRSLAAYAQGTLAILPKLNIVFGGRYTDDKKSGDYELALHNPAAALIRAAESTQLTYKGNKFTLRANVNYHPTRDITLFATYSTGYKAGGFNSGIGAVALGQQRIFDPETTKNYELGVKSQWFDRRLTANFTLFRDDVEGFQDRAFNGVTAFVVNAGSLRQQGVEGELIVRPARGLSLSAAATYLHSAFLSYPNATGLPAFGGNQDLKGKPNNYSPKWQGNIGAQYDGRFGETGWRYTLRSDLSFVSSQYESSATDANPQAIEPAYQILTARVTIQPNDRLSVSVYGDNLTKTNYCTYRSIQTLDGILGVRNPQTGGTALDCAVGSPRTYGVRAQYRF